MNPMKTRAMTTLIFQSASAATITLRPTSVATAARRAVRPMPGLVAHPSNGGTPMEEQVFVEERRHGIVLGRPLVRALLLALLGATGVAVGWPASIAGVLLLFAAAGYAIAAVLRWD